LDKPPSGPEPSSATKLQILSTEHWSLLATRSLTYTESFSRVGMFLSVLSGAVIALALIAQADRFGETFVLIAILLLSVVLFVGVGTIARLMSINEDDLRWVMGMNRLRHAYLELHPELERYFVASDRDDIRGISLTMGLANVPDRGFAALPHGLQTLPGMVSVIVAAVFGALCGLAAHAAAAPTAVVVGGALGGFVASLVLSTIWGIRSISGYARRIAPQFPGVD
jgi:hypothetical protein